MYLVSNNYLLFLTLWKRDIPYYILIIV